MKKTLALVLTLTMLLSLVPFGFSVPVAAAPEGLIAHYDFDGEDEGLTAHGGNFIQRDGTVTLGYNSYFTSDVDLSTLTEITLAFRIKSLFDGEWAFDITSQANHNDTGGQGESYFGCGLRGGNYVAVEPFASGRNHDGSSIDAYNTGIDNQLWHDVVVTFKEGTTTIYVDGVKGCAENSNGHAHSFDKALSDIIGSDPTLYIGRANWNAGEFAYGLEIDSFSVYNVALSDVTTAVQDTDTTDYGTSTAHTGVWETSFSKGYAITGTHEFDIRVLGGNENHQNVSAFFVNGPVEAGSTHPSAQITDYKLYSIIRADEFSWHVWDPFHTSADGNPITYNSTLTDVNGNGDKWDDFRATMNNAYIHATVSLVADLDTETAGDQPGYRLQYDVLGENGQSFTYIAETVCNTENLHVTFACDGSYFVVCDHSAGLNDVAANAPTCEGTGNNAYKVCKSCATVFKADGTTKTTVAAETLPATDHNYATTWSRDDEYHYYACPNVGCETPKKDVTRHEFGDPTCIEPATCVCGATTGTTLNHEPDTAWSKDSTGHWHACKKTPGCTHKDSFDTHEYGGDDTCDVCAYSDHEHVTQEVPAKDKKCYEAGNIKHYTCTVCGSLFEDEAATIPLSASDVDLGKADHDYAPATCTAPKTCKVTACGAVEPGSTKLGHSFTNYVSDGNSSWTAKGTETAICDREGCNEPDIREANTTVELSGGWWTSWTPAYEISCKHEFDIDVKGGAEKWNNFSIVFINVETSGNVAPHTEIQGYKEYALIRTDSWGWGGGDNKSLDGNPIVYNSTLTDINESGSTDDEFIATMADAHVDAVVQRTANGVKITYNVTGANGVTFTYTAETEVATEDLYVFFACDGSEVTVTPVIQTTTDHDFGEATCAAPKTCSKCGVTEGDALSHTPATEWSKDETNHWHDCTVCGNEADTPEAHDWNPATCNAPKTCKVCGATEGTKLEHTYAETWSKNATHHWHACTLCGAKKDEAAHTYEGENCSVCGFEKDHVHSISFVEEVPATCKAPGKKAHYACAGCDDLFEDAAGTKPITDPNTLVIDALAHDYAPATCKAPKTCKVCGATTGEKLAHDFAPATCTAPKTCKVCGETEGEKLAHSFTKYVDNGDGTETAKCDNCDEKDTRKTSGSNGEETKGETVTISGGWCSEFTPDYKLDDTLKFDIDVKGGTENWNNVSIFFTNGPADAEGYKEYAIIRADSFSWAIWESFHQSLDGNPVTYTSTIVDADNDGDTWDDFREIMADAHIDAVVEKTSKGFKITYNVTGANGKSFVYTAETECETENLHVKFACDNSEVSVTPIYSEGNGPSAPQTGIATAILAVLAILSGGYVISKKRRF